MVNIMVNLIELLFAVSNAVAFAMSAYLFTQGSDHHRHGVHYLSLQQHAR